MRAGMLRHRVVIEQVTEAQNDYGEPVETWAELATVWARKEDLSGRELFAAQQVQSTVTTRFTIRYRSDVQAKQRLSHAGTVYNIESVQDPDGRRCFLYVLASRLS